MSKLNEARAALASLQETYRNDAWTLKRIDLIAAGLDEAERRAEDAECEALRLLHEDRESNADWLDEEYFGEWFVEISYEMLAYALADAESGEEERHGQC